MSSASCWVFVLLLGASASSDVYITSAEGDDVQFNCTGRNATLLKIGGLSPKPATPPVLTLHCSDGGGGCTTSFLLTNVTSEDTGEYVCSMGLQTYYHLNVTAAPARRPLPTRSTHPDVVTSLFMTIPVPTETPTASNGANSTVIGQGLPAVVIITYVVVIGAIIMTALLGLIILSMYMMRNII